MYLDVCGGKTHQGNNLHLWPFNGTPAQVFTMHPDGTIQSSLSDLVIDVQGGVTNGAKLIMWPRHGGANQTWVVEGTQVKLRGHALCFDSPGGKTEKGTQIIAWTKHGGPNQQWQLVDVDSNSPIQSVVNVQFKPENIYTIELAVDELKCDGTNQAGWFLSAHRSDKRDQRNGHSTHIIIHKPGWDMKSWRIVPVDMSKNL